MVNNSNKKRLLIMLITMFALALALPYSTGEAASADKQRIFDYGKLLTDKEKSHLEKKAALYSEKRKTDFIIITHKREEDPMITAETYMANFYDDKAPGYDEKYGNTAILSYIDDVPGERDIYIGGFKKAEKTLKSSRIETLLDKVVPYLANDQYAEGFELYLDKAYEYSGVRFGINPESVFLKTWFQLLVAVAIGAVVLWGMLRNVGGKITVSGATYNDSGQTQLLDKEDRFIRTTVTRVRKPENNNSGGGGGGGGGGMTSGGHSYSGGGRRF